jgi:reverse transcriptase-like protein/aspartyl protease/zinc knuckle protein
MTTRVSRSQAHAARIVPSGIPVPVRRPSVLPGPQPETAEVTRLYSDVAASRPPSPREETITRDPEGPDHQFDDMTRPVTDIEISSDENEEPLWKTIQRRRAQSLDSAGKKLGNQVVYVNPNLSTEQKLAVDTAANKLTKEQLANIERRQEIVSAQIGVEEAGPSNNKGKTIDPREWGNVGIDQEELNPETQAAIISAYQEKRSKTSKKGRSKKLKGGKRHETSSDSRSENDEDFPIPQISKHKKVVSAGHAGKNEIRRAASRPAAQIVRDSSLGVALGNVAFRHGDSGDDSSDSSYDSSNSSDSDDDEYSNSTRSYSSTRSRRRRRHSKSKKTQRKYYRRDKKSKSSSSIKPIPPKEYNGSASSRDYHRFVMEGEAYLRDGNVHKERQIRVLAHYLEGKAYDFYMQKVTPENPANWNLHKFFTELFNYCFPIDYRQRMRLKLEDLYQGTQQSVSEYVYELQELFNMVGAMSPELKVIKLWYSLRPKIQRIMWKDGLHPDTSTWEEVVAKAEVIEIADHVIDPRERRSAQMASSSHNSRNTNSGGNYRSRSMQSNTTGSRSITFSSRGRSNNRTNINYSQRRENNGQPGSQTRRDSGQQQTNRARFAPQNRGNMSRTITDGRMPNSNSGRKRTKNPYNLSDKEMAELRAAGKCFKCKNIGHMSKDCPENNSVPGNGTNRPPGIPSYSMQMNLIEDIDDSEEVLESMPVGMMSIGPDTSSEYYYQANPNWRNYYPFGQSLRALGPPNIGDCYAMTTEYLLTILQPYPGDHFWEEHVWPCSPDTRFRVERRGGYNYSFCITDRLAEIDIIITKSQLSNPKFNLGHWYAKNRARALGLKDSMKEEYFIPMDDPIASITKQVLQSGIHAHFPNTNPETDSDTRFLVYLKDPESSTYVIIDDDLELKVEVNRGLLENPRFDLITWYYKHAIKDGRFYQLYLLQHKHRYAPIPDGEDDPFLETSWPKPRENTEDNLLELKSYSDSLLLKEIIHTLESCQPYPGDGPPVDPTYSEDDFRFRAARESRNLLCIYDRVQGQEAYLLWDIARWDQFSIGKWFVERCAAGRLEPRPWEVADNWIRSRIWPDTTIARDTGYTVCLSEHSSDSDVDDLEFFNDSDIFSVVSDASLVINTVELSGVQVDRNKYVNIQRNAARVKNVTERLLPKPVVIRLNVNGHPVRALIDSGSLSDFISSTTVDQLKLKRNIFDKPLGLQLAVQGSRSKINAFVNIDYSYQDITDSRRFDVANLNDYDLILGTPWMYQHQVCIGLNPARIVIGSNTPLPIKSGVDTKFLLGATSISANLEIDAARNELMAYAEPLCRTIEEMELPPLRAINHTIPLIDVDKTYRWRPSRCPEIFREQWIQKKNAYVKSGRWEMSSARNTVPMLLIPKPHKPKNAPELRTVFDLRERNKNTHKLSSPLPDIDGVLRRVAAKPFRSVLDLTLAFEQIRIVPEHVERTAVTTPDGNMVSNVLQMGDCNGPATHQSLMNYIFSPYLGRFLDVYLDDVIVYSDTLAEHIKHCKIAMNILRWEKLYLSKKKLNFLAESLKLLGRIIDSGGIRMDPEKVDSVLAWKTPTNRDLLRGFIGSVGYLADDIPNVRIPLGSLAQ